MSGSEEQFGPPDERLRETLAALLLATAAFGALAHLEWRGRASTR